MSVSADETQFVVLDEPAAEESTAPPQHDDRDEIVAEAMAEGEAIEHARREAARLDPVDRSAPVRFVWRTDAEGKFSALSPEFADIVGKPAADVIGRRFKDVSQRPSASMPRRRDRRPARTARHLVGPLGAVAGRRHRSEDPGRSGGAAGLRPQPRIRRFPWFRRRPRQRCGGRSRSDRHGACPQWRARRRRSDAERSREPMHRKQGWRRD